MQKLWHDEAWDEYLLWQSLDKKALKKSTGSFRISSAMGITALENQNRSEKICPVFGVSTLMQRIVSFLGFKMGNWK